MLTLISNMSTDIDPLILEITSNGQRTEVFYITQQHSESFWILRRTSKATSYNMKMTL
jgi:hypothetical protein